MTLKFATLVRQTADNPGTATFNLIAPVTGRQSFVDAIGDGNTCYYVASGAQGTEWGIGTVSSSTPDLLARTTVIGNDAGGASKLNFTGTVTIYNALLGEHVVWRDHNGLVGIGIDTPDGVTAAIHIHTASAGSVAAHAAADQLILENSAAAGLSILTPNTANGAIFFGDPESNSVGQIAYAHNGNSMRFHADGGEKMRLNTSGLVIGLSTITPDGLLHLHYLFSESRLCHLS